MLPPIDPATLERNAKFKVLFEDLSQNKLNANGSTKDVKRQRHIDQTRQDLTAKRTNISRAQILRTSLETLSARSSDLPNELHEVTTIVAALLNGRIPSSEREILQEDIDYFTDHIVPISRALSAHLKSLAQQLCRIASPADSTSIPDLAATAQDQRDEIEAATNVLADQRTRLADLAVAVLEAQARLMEVVVRMLEQTVHGSVARAVRAKAEHLAAVAKGLELKLSILTLTSNPSAPLAAAVVNYGEWLGKEKEELRHRQAIDEDRLRAFEKAGGEGKDRIMKEIARRYVEIEEEIAKVQLEVGRLEGS